MPLIELVVIIKVGSAIGAFETVALLVLCSLVGVWLVKQQGLAVLRRAQREADAGRVPTASLLDGVLLLVAGGLLIFPGFVTDIVGALLLLPPVRYVLRRLLVARYGRASPPGRHGLAGRPPAGALGADRRRREPRAARTAARPVRPAGSDRLEGPAAAVARPELSATGAGSWHWA